MTVRIRDEAEAELEAAFDYYEARSKGLGHRFLDDYVHGTHVIAEAPQRWPSDASDVRAKRYRLDHFPYSLVYQVFQDHVLIVAVAHAHRRPGYWHERLF
jgi:plasmid stabilization system protein ParE